MPFEDLSAEKKEDRAGENPLFAAAYDLACATGNLIAAPYKNLANDFQNDPVHTTVETVGGMAFSCAAVAAVARKLPPVLAGMVFGAVAMKATDLMMHGNSCTLNPERLNKLGPLHPEPLFPVKLGEGKASLH